MCLRDINQNQQWCFMLYVWHLQIINEGQSHTVKRRKQYTIYQHYCIFFLSSCHTLHANIFICHYNSKICHRCVPLGFEFYLINKVHLKRILCKITAELNAVLFTIIQIKYWSRKWVLLDMTFSIQWLQILGDNIFLTLE